MAALKAANWRSRWAAACSPRSSCRAPEMDVRGVDDPEHRGGGSPPLDGHERTTEESATTGPDPTVGAIRGDGASEAPP